MIPYTKPSITALEVAYAADAAQNGWGEHCYDYIVRFERAFAEHIGVKHAIATSSCTGALHLGFAALPGEAESEVILADTNWVASVAPLVHLGIKPVFVDILTDTWCLDPEKVELAITPRTKAILAVHIYGNMCDMQRLNDIGRRYGIPVIEDAAEAIGSSLGAQKAGSIGTFGSFSFHGTKTVTTGEGGMLVTDDSGLFERALTLSNHGRRRGDTRQFWPETVGYKFKMSNIQAALGLAQMERIDELIARKKQILAYYRDALRDLPVTLNPSDGYATTGAWMPTVVFDEDTGVTSEVAREKFASHDIDARPFFHPLSSTGLFESSGVHTPNAHLICGRAVNIPSYHDMTTDDQDRVVEAVKSCLPRQGSRSPAVAGLARD
ncbi:DegT/DnrJ/EryC1/StrS family aminotransferase [Amorphus sp. MBR-141]